MGVDRTDYLMYGWKLSKKLEEKIHDDFDVFEKYFDNGKYEIVVDNMLGEWAAFGKVLETGDEYAGWQFIDVNKKILKVNKEEAIAEYKKVFGVAPKKDPAVLLFTHYS